jgi:glucose-6-phosphate isomerase
VPGAKGGPAALVEASVPGLLAEKDPTLWGPAAEEEAQVRLGWVDTFRRSRELVPRWSSCATSSPTSTTWCSPAWAARRWRPR